jgi:hypothetical protein
VARIPPDLHRQVSVSAIRSGQSINAWVTDRLREAVGQPAIAAAKKPKKPARKRTSTR